MTHTPAPIIRRTLQSDWFPAAVAVILWSLAPTLGELARTVPPLQLTGLCMGVASLITALFVYRPRAGVRARMRAPASTWLLAPALMAGAVGCYFWALARAPADNVTLVTYVWPVLFVVATEAIALRRVRLRVVAGCALAFAGAALLVGSEASPIGSSWTGYAAAVVSGLSWTGFSLLARHQRVPLAHLLPALCMIAALWAALVHGLTEPTLWRIAGPQALWIVLIGAGPYGLAFLFWDHALRRGPGTVVGTMAYAVPIISAAILLAAGFAALRWQLPVAAAMVVVGCVIGSRAAAKPVARLRA